MRGREPDRLPVGERARSTNASAWNLGGACQRVTAAADQADLGPMSARADEPMSIASYAKLVGLAAGEVCK